jgi:membrane-associated protease RseP (regulator of RpoE activity)
MKILRPLLHLGLFIATFFTLTVAGVQWMYYDPFNLQNFHYGITYACTILSILGAHEFGHFFASRYHKVDATLPYFIPFPNLPGMLNFGTLGAVIKTRTPVPSRKAMFDIGVAGPIAGFIVSIASLVYGFLNLPGIDYLLRMHPEYLSNQPSTGIPLVFGNTLLYDALRILLTNPTAEFVPPMSEMYHYPFLCAGWFGLFVTSMNLLPVGQLDGGHIAYAMFGEKHRLISRITFGLLLMIGLSGLLPLLDIGWEFGWTGWLLWALILFLVVKLDHPPIGDDTPLDQNRRLVGWFAVFMLAVSFSPSPFSIIF